MKKLIIPGLVIFCSANLIAQNNIMTPGDESREQMRKSIKQTPKWVITDNKIYILKGFTDSTQLNFTKKSDCEFKCIKISDALLRSILKNGTVNISKSDLRSSVPTYAVEATADTGESFRVLASPEGEALKIHSVNQLFKKSECDCKE